MPAVIPEHEALRARLGDTVKEAVVLDLRLEAVIAQKPAQGQAGIFHGKIDHSQPPWNAAVADAILDLHARSREAEALMRLRLGFPARHRGGSAANTRNALSNITRLAQGCDDETVRGTGRWLDAWCRKARIVLGEAEAAKRLPRAVGEKSALCPWCRKDTLRQLALAGTIFCADPSCTDSEGRRPRAQLEYFDNDFALRWQDDLLGNP